MNSISRKQSLQWIMAASVSLAALEAKSGFYQDYKNGLGSDPNLLEYKVPWPLIMNKQQLDTASSLCGLIIPADDRSPSASDIGVHDFINEWISAPYPQQQGHQKQILHFLNWIEPTAKSLYQKSFHECSIKQQTDLCDQICYPHKTKPEWRPYSHQFGLFRMLCGGAFYTSPEGMKDLQYMGNVPLAKFEGPPPEVLKRLGLSE